MVNRGPRSEIVHYLDVEDVFVSFLSAQVDMSLWGESIERLQVESDAAETVLGHLIGRVASIILVADLVSDQELDFIRLHQTCSHPQRKYKFASLFDLIEETHPRESEYHWVAAHSKAVSELVLIGVIIHLQFSFLHLSEDECAQLLVIGNGTFRLDLNFGAHLSRSLEHIVNKVVRPIKQLL